MRPNSTPTEWRSVAGALVASFVDAVNDVDAGKVIDLFADDAHVNDQLRDFWGKARIAEWIRREIVGERFTMDVVQAKQHFADLILTANVSGDFDKTGLPDPMTLTFIFSTRDGKITRLITLMNLPSDEAELRRPGV